MTIHPDKSERDRIVAASEKFLALLNDHHGGSEPVVVAPVDRTGAEPEQIAVTVEPDTAATGPISRPARRDWLMVAQATPSIRDIQRAVANHYGFTRLELRSKRRTAAVARARQIAMYVVKSTTPMSYPQIGRHFGGRDHSTILHGVRKIEHLIESDSALKADVDAFRAQFSCEDAQ